MESARIISVFLTRIRNMNRAFRMVTVAELFQHPVIEFLIKKLGIIHGLIGKENAYGQEDNSSHPHTCERLHHVFLNKFSSEIIQEKKDNEEYNGEDQGKTDPSFSNNGTQWGTDHEKYQECDGHSNFFMPGHQVKSQVFAIVFITDG